MEDYKLEKVKTGKYCQKKCFQLQLLKLFIIILKTLEILN